MLVDRGSPMRNLTVQILDPSAFDETFHAKFDRFTRSEDLLPAKDVAYTIFPHRLYARTGGGAALYKSYNRPRGMYERVKTGWGTYFRRLTAYLPPGSDGPAVNQLKKVVDRINARDAVYTAAYHMEIAYPGNETTRDRGGPCLNYIAVQLEPDPRRLGLLCVYRNHDFLQKAYGNYWALCNLLRFLCDETGFDPGVLTCLSSHAYTDAAGVLRRLVRVFDGNSPAAVRAS
jgi:thymidylate synthase